MGANKNLTQVRRSLDQAKRLLDGAGRYDAAEWMLLATLVGDADLIVRGDPQIDPDLRAVMDRVVLDLREVTSNFTSPEFLLATAAARRRR